MVAEAARTLRGAGFAVRLEADQLGREEAAEAALVSLFDFGTFQDRILLKQFLESTMNVKFSPVATSHERTFYELNEALVEIRDQMATLFPDQKELHQPFLNCWFLSVPQLLVLLDGVTDGATVRAECWSYQHIDTGSSDLYFDLSRMRRLKRAAASEAN